MIAGPLWRVQLWLGEHLIEEHITPAELAQAYADAIKLRIAGLPGRQLRCSPAGSPELSTSTATSQNWQGRHPASGA